MQKHYQWLLREIPDIEECIGVTFNDKKLLALAFVHRSFFNENRQEVLEHNERLEFLGDSVLSTVISQYIFKSCNEMAEGQLTRIRANIVCEQ